MGGGCKEKNCVEVIYQLLACPYAGVNPCAYRVLNTVYLDFWGL